MRLTQAAGWRARPQVLNAVRLDPPRFGMRGRVSTLRSWTPLVTAGHHYHAAAFINHATAYDALLAAGAMASALCANTGVSSWVCIAVLDVLAKHFDALAVWRAAGGAVADGAASSTGAAIQCGDDPARAGDGRAGRGRTGPVRFMSRRAARGGRAQRRGRGGHAGGRASGGLALCCLSAAAGGGRRAGGARALGVKMGVWCGVCVVSSQAPRSPSLRPFGGA